MADRSKVSQDVFQYYTKPQVTQRVTGGVKQAIAPRRSALRDFLGIVETTKSVFDEANKLYSKENRDKAIVAHATGKDKPKAEGFLNTGKGLEEYNVREGAQLADIVSQALKNDFNNNNGYKDKIVKRIIDGKFTFDVSGVQQSLDEVFQATINDVFGDSLQDPDILRGASETLNAVQRELNAMAVNSNFEFARENVFNGLNQKDLSTISKYVQLKTLDDVSGGPRRTQLIKKALDENTNIFGKEMINAGYITRDEQTNARIDTISDYISNTLLGKVTKEDGTISYNIDYDGISTLKDVFFEKGDNGISWFDMKDKDGNFKFRDKILRVLSNINSDLSTVEKQAELAAIETYKANKGLVERKILNKEVDKKQLDAYMDTGYLRDEDYEHLLSMLNNTLENSYVPMNETRLKAFYGAKQSIIANEKTAGDIISEIAFPKNYNEELFKLEEDLNKMRMENPNYKVYEDKLKTNFRLPNFVDFEGAKYEPNYYATLAEYNELVMDGFKPSEAYNRAIIKHDKQGEVVRRLIRINNISGILNSVEQDVDGNVFYTIPGSAEEESIKVSRTQLGEFILSVKDRSNQGITVSDEMKDILEDLEEELLLEEETVINTLGAINNFVK